MGFSVGGAAALVVGPALEDRLAGVLCLVLFGAGGAFYLYATQEGPAPEPEVNVARTDLLGLSEPALELPMDKPVPRAAAFAIAICLGLVLVAFGIVDGSIVPIALGALVLGRSATSAWWPCAAARGPSGSSSRPPASGTSTLSARSASAGTTSTGWALYETDDVPTIGIQAPPEAVVQRTGSRRMTEVGRMLTGAGISIPMITIDADPERLADAISAYADDPSPLRDPQRERDALVARLHPVIAPRTSR